MEEAIPDFKKALTLNSIFTEVHYRLTSAFGQQGQFGKAQMLFEQTLSINAKLLLPDYETRGHLSRLQTIS
jgi:hypothetical protein